MKKIYSQIKGFYIHDLKRSYLIALLCFLALLIGINYQFDIHSDWLKPLKRTSIYPVYMFLFYAVPYYGAFLLYAFFYDDKKIFTSKKFWLPSLMAVFVLTFNESVYIHQLWVESTVAPEIQSFIWKCSNDFVSVFMYFVPVWIYWYAVDRKKYTLYGFGVAHFDPRPYLIMLLLMTPLLISASFTTDFQDAYPIYDDRGFSSVLGIPEWVSVCIFEFFYGADFVMVEFVFRGFMVIALIEVVGIHAVLPMATVYCVFHFGKPAGETISSFFGGTILGIVAYHSRSIYGGILVHCGIAFLMELFAFIMKN